MPAVIPKQSGGAKPWSAGEIYNVNDIVDIRGSQFRVTTLINPAGTYADYDSLECISHGFGTATYRDYNTDLGVDNWCHIADISPYTSASVNIGGLFNGKQSSMTINVETTYKYAHFSGDAILHSEQAVKTIKLKQNSDGGVWELWINVVRTASNFQMHTVITAAGNTRVSVTNNAVSQSAQPSAGSKQYFEVVPTTQVGDWKFDSEESGSGTVFKKGSITLVSGSSDYIHIATIPALTSCSFRVAINDAGLHPNIAGSITTSNSDAGIEAKLSQEDGADGLYALRLTQPSDGADYKLWLVYGGVPSGSSLMSLNISYNNPDGKRVIIPTFTRVSSIESGIKADLKLYGLGVNAEASTYDDGVSSGATLFMSGRTANTGMPCNDNFDFGVGGRWVDNFTSGGFTLQTTGLRVNTNGVYHFTFNYRQDDSTDPVHIRRSNGQWYDTPMNPVEHNSLRSHQITARLNAGEEFRVVRSTGADTRISEASFSIHKLSD